MQISDPDPWPTRAYVGPGNEALLDVAGWAALFQDPAWPLI